ncbi:hypothetical protein [Mesorhizobium sp. M0768]|uniref:beta strand repeat-containing protein n=1 Tax=Mesorhizobium sp. M0768 TaxID=2956996 RepID=UPI003334C0A8
MSDLFPSRKMTPGEIDMARRYYGDEIDYSKVDINKFSYFVGQPSYTYVTPNNGIYIGKDDPSYQDDYSNPTLSVGQRSQFMHELMHIFQYQHRAGLFNSGLFKNNFFYRNPFVPGSGPYYEYGPLASVKSFNGLNIEQQAHLFQDYFETVEKGGQRPDLAPFEKVLPRIFHYSPAIRLPDQAPIPGPRNSDPSLSPSTNRGSARGGSEFGGSSQPGASAQPSGSERGGNVRGTPSTGPRSSPAASPSQSPTDARAPDRGTMPSSGATSPSRAISTPSTAPTPTSRPESNYAPGAITRAPLAAPTSDPVPGHYEADHGFWHWVGKPEDEPGYGVLPNVNLPNIEIDPTPTQSIHNMSIPGNPLGAFGNAVAGVFGGVVGAIGGLIGGIVGGIAHAIGNVFGGGGSGGSGSGSTSGSGGAPTSSGGGSTAVGDHAGHYNGGYPVLLDLSGNGLSIDPLSSSSQFLDLDGDGYQHRTAWADSGTGVLVLDADGDGKISRSSEFVFTEWDQTATSDLEALKSVFDTNHNGLLDAGDERWSEFKVMVDGQLVSLASLGIASIGLTPTSSGQNFTDGSAITGTAQFTRTDGTTGTVGDAVLVSDSNGYTIKSTTVTNGDGSRTTDLAGYGKDGTLAFQNRITVSADGLSTTTQFDDDGNGTYERSQTDVTTITAGVRKRVVSDFNTDGSLADRTTTTTSADKTTVTTTLDQDGDGAVDQTQVFVKNADGSATTTVSETSVNGTLLRKIATTASANGLSKTVQVDSTGNGVYDLTSTETTVIAGDGTRTKTVANTSSSGTLIAKEQTVTSADGRTRTVSHDLDGNGTYETRDVTAITDGANDVSVTTVSSYSSTNALIGKSVITTSDDGLAKTASTDLDGDGLFDVISSDVTVVGAGGSLTETQQLKSRDGSLLGSSTTDTSADRKTISISTDGDGDGRTDAVKTIVIDGAGVTTTTGILYNPDGSIVGKTFDQSSANGLSLTNKADLNSDGVYDVIVTDVTIPDASSNHTRTVTTTSASGALIGSSAVTTSADSLTQTVKDDINADGTVDRTTVQATVLGSDGSRTVTTTTTSTSGAMLARTEVKTSADRKTTTTTIDANGDTKIDRTQVAVVNADGSQVATISDTDINGVLHAKSETTLSANGLIKTNKQDVNGDGVYDVITQAVTVIATTGVRTNTTSQTSTNGTLLSKTIAAVSANGLSVDAQFDADGDGVIEGKSSDVTVLTLTARRPERFPSLPALALCSARPLPLPALTASRRRSRPMLTATAPSTGPAPQPRSWLPMVPSLTRSRSRTAAMPRSSARRRLPAATGIQSRRRTTLMATEPQTRT